MWVLCNAVPLVDHLDVMNRTACVCISGRGCGIYIYTLWETIPEYPVTLTDRDRGE